jgi:hypothetical protein
VAAFGDQ